MIEVIHIDMAKSTIFYGRIMSCGWFWWWCMDADLMSAQFFNFFLFLFGIFFFWCVFIIVVRGSFPGMIILGENITFKAFFCPYCKRKTKTLSYFFFPSIDACKHSWFFVLNIKSLTALAVQNGHHWCIFSYWILSFVWFALFWDLGDLRR